MVVYYEILLKKFCFGRKIIIIVRGLGHGVSEKRVCSSKLFGGRRYQCRDDDSL